MSRIRVGPAGWDYPDWKGVVFPHPRPKGFDPLSYLAGYFSTIEINSTFYGPATVATAEKWSDRVGDHQDFKFTAKLWRRFTHERGSAWTSDELATARAGFDVLLKRGRLGAVLIQFPWSYRFNEQNMQWLGDLRAGLEGLPLVLEVRHATWNSPEVFDTLTEWGMGLVNVDQPLFANSIKPAARAIGAVGYVRLHGRNYRDWFRKSAGRDERYDYLYTAGELRPWVERIEAIAKQVTTKEVYAVTNNHHVGKAPANAEMLEGMLTGRKVRSPPTLFDKYAAQLEPFAAPG